MRSPDATINIKMEIKNARQVAQGERRTEQNKIKKRYKWSELDLCIHTQKKTILRK